MHSIVAIVGVLRFALFYTRIHFIYYKFSMYKHITVKIPKKIQWLTALEDRSKKEAREKTFLHFSFLLNRRN